MNTFAGSLQTRFYLMTSEAEPVDLQWINEVQETWNQAKDIQFELIFSAPSNYQIKGATKINGKNGFTHSMPVQNLLQQTEVKIIGSYKKILSKGFLTTNLSVIKNQMIIDESCREVVQSYTPILKSEHYILKAFCEKAPHGKTKIIISGIMDSVVTKVSKETNASSTLVLEPFNIVLLPQKVEKSVAILHLLKSEDFRAGFFFNQAHGQNEFTKSNISNLGIEAAYHYNTANSFLTSHEVKLSALSFAHQSFQPKKQKIYHWESQFIFPYECIGKVAPLATVSYRGYYINEENEIDLASINLGFTYTSSNFKTDFFTSVLENRNRGSLIGARVRYQHAKFYYAISAEHIAVGSSKAFSLIPSIGTFF